MVRLKVVVVEWLVVRCRCPQGLYAFYRFFLLIYRLLGQLSLRLFHLWKVDGREVYLSQLNVGQGQYLAYVRVYLGYKLLVHWLLGSYTWFLCHLSDLFSFLLLVLVDLALVLFSEAVHIELNNLVISFVFFLEVRDLCFLSLSNILVHVPVAAVYIHVVQLWNVLAVW